MLKYFENLKHSFQKQPSAGACVLVGMVEAGVEAGVEVDPI